MAITSDPIATRQPSAEPLQGSTPRPIDIQRGFFTLGRCTPPAVYRPLGRLDPEKRHLITERAQIEAQGGSWLSAEAVGLTPKDVLAFVANGSQIEGLPLREQIDRWWKAREGSELWKPKEPPRGKLLRFVERMLEYPVQRRAKKIATDLGYSAQEMPAVIRIDRFSRKTVYTRDYAPIPKRIKSFFKTVPLLIFAPRDATDLKKIVEYANAKRICLTPRGRGTWALGGAILTKGGIALDLASFERKLWVDATNQTVTVGPTNDFQEAEEALNDYGLTLMVRPSNKYGTIGGFLSVGEPGLGGLGLNAYRYGHIVNSVDSMRVVTGKGEELFLKKGDPDFPFFLGTNGRNGIITEITLKAIPKPEEHYPVALRFSNLREAFDFLRELHADIATSKAPFHPVHVEVFSAEYLRELEKLSAELYPTFASPSQLTARDQVQDTVLIVFYSKTDEAAFQQYIRNKQGICQAEQAEARHLWEERFQPMKLRKKGDLLATEVILPLHQARAYVDHIRTFARSVEIDILPVAYLLNTGEVLIIAQFLTDRRDRLHYYQRFSILPVLADVAMEKYGGRPYGFGLWFAGLSRRALGRDRFEALKQAKRRFDPKSVLNPGKLTEIRGRLWNVPARLLLPPFSLHLLYAAIRLQSLAGKIGWFRRRILQQEIQPYGRERGDALHRCIKCSACMICPLAQIWQKSGDPRLMRDAIYITPRFKMEFMQRHLYEGKKLTPEDVDRFVLCLRCGVAEREHVCPISDQLLEIEGDDGQLKKKFPTYDAFEDLLRREGYDVDGAIQRYMDILKTHPGVACAMEEVLGKTRVPKSGDLVILQPKTDFAIYRVDVDLNRCINCGKCGDEHTTSQRGFWDPREPRRMVSLDDLIRELDGRIPLSWLQENGGPLPNGIQAQGVIEDGHLRLPVGSPLDLGHRHCNGCLYCVIECPVDAIRVHINDYYTQLGGRDFTKEDVRRINEESKTADVPTSGTGATALFGGKGFDRYMFDFSVIVRPTRDGIREAIDIGVNLGRRVLFHFFDANGHIKTRFHTLDLSTPILLEVPEIPGRELSDVAEVMARTARREGTVVLMDLALFLRHYERLKSLAPHIALRFTSGEIQSLPTRLMGSSDGLPQDLTEMLRQVRLVELQPEKAAPHSTSEERSKTTEELLQETRQLIDFVFGQDTVLAILVEAPANSNPADVARRVETLAEAGAEIIHLKTQYNDAKGYYESAELIPAAYDRLLEKGIHSQVCLLADGIKSPADVGIAMMLGASAAVIDRAALVALNYEFPMLERQGKVLPPVELNHGLERLHNLFNSWHKQIKEVLGAFGVRDIRRIVGERGRLIDLGEREKLMHDIVTDRELIEKSKEVNREKLEEDGELARQHSLTYSRLSELIQPVIAPNVNLLGERKESLEAMIAARGDRRWTADLLCASWLLASGQVPSHRVPQTGRDFGGGSLDSMRFAPVSLNGRLVSLEEAMEELDQRLRAGDAQLLQALNQISIAPGVSNFHRRPESEPIVSTGPIDAADMSLGSIGWKLTLARYLAGMILQRFTGTGEGGYPLGRPERLVRFFPRLLFEEVQWLARQLEPWVATQTATGYFGVTEDTIRRANKLVLKFAQGAKPGLGGHILGPKVTLEVEDLRGVPAGISVFSPFPFHDVYSIEDVPKMIEWLRTLNPDAIITVKISTPVDVYHIALGLVTAGADEIQIDATAGGTGAAPDIARNRIAMPLEYALADVHKFLIEEGVRNQVLLVASGGLRSAYDVAKALILGADKVILGTQEIVADQCNRCGNCEAPGGCQKGITTTVPELEAQKDIALNAQWIINAQAAILQHLIKLMYVWGVKDLRELRGRFDLIADWGWREEWGVKREKKTEHLAGAVAPIPTRAEEDACGVVSFACTQAVPVESIQTACQRMHNRGNGRGGGILGLGGLFAKSHQDHYALQIICLAPKAERPWKIREIAQRHLADYHVFDRHGRVIDLTSLALEDFERFRNPRRQKNGRDISWKEAGLRVDAGDLYRFFVRVKPEALLRFAKHVLEESRLSDSERALWQQGRFNELLQRVVVKGRWLDYLVKYVPMLTDEYLESIDAKSEFWKEAGHENLWRDLEDEFVYRRSFAINQEYYIEPQAARGQPEAFVSSMMKDGGIWKLVGYAEQAVDYWIIGDAEYVPLDRLGETLDGILPFWSELEPYVQRYRQGILPAERQECLVNESLRVTLHPDEHQLELVVRTKADRVVSVIFPRQGDTAVVIFNRDAHAWIGHQRFPTVFSPYSGGSHPFYGRITEALIHNGDFANYVAMVRFWDRLGGAPQFRTDTEMAAKAFAILKQMNYPLPHLLEAIAPTTGVDFLRLLRANPELAADFEAIQKAQIGGSPDGPWFFIIGDQDPMTRELRILGITDTSVLRPSIFAWVESGNGNGAHPADLSLSSKAGGASVGLVGSEEQALRSVLENLYLQGVIPTKEPDAVKIIRGGSVEQEHERDVRGGGTIVYTLKPQEDDGYALEVTDKFGNPLRGEQGTHADLSAPVQSDTDQVQTVAKELFDEAGGLRYDSARDIYQYVKRHLREWDFNTYRWFVTQMVRRAENDEYRAPAIQVLTNLKDKMKAIDPGTKRRSSLTHITTDGLDAIFDAIEKVGTGDSQRRFHRMTWEERHPLPPPSHADQVLVIDGTRFPAEGHQSLARAMVEAYQKGWKKFIAYKLAGHRYLGSGFGPGAQGVEIHLYGNAGQDIGNSMMGITLHVHGDAQNDMGKILHSGTLVVHGLAGNTGIYGAKGGEVFIRESTGIRWVINSVSSPAGPGLRVVIIGSAMEYLAESLMGGTVLVMGLEWDEAGRLRRKFLPYSGNSILAGASAGKVVIYDPDDRLEPKQYKGAVNVGFLSGDWGEVVLRLNQMIRDQFTAQEWHEVVERWKSFIDLAFRDKDWQAEVKSETLAELAQLIREIPDVAAAPKEAREMGQLLRQIVEEWFTDREWRRVVRLLGQIVQSNWKEGITFLDRLRDWKEMTELLWKADAHFDLGLQEADGRLTLELDGQRVELRREDFKVIRPPTPKEKAEREKI